MIRLLKICAVGLLIYSIPLFGQDTSIDLKIRYYESKIKTYLDKENGLSPFYTINEEGIKIYASGSHKALNRPEFRIGWNQLEAFKRDLKQCPVSDALRVYKSGTYETTTNCLRKEADTLGGNKKGVFAGYRIAIDAGHTAGDVYTGVIEKKYLKFKPQPNMGLKDSVELAEGMLTYATASLLKEKLENEGAEIFLTRPFNGSTAYGITFEEWLRTEFKNTIDAWYNAGRITAEKRTWFLTKASKSDKFWHVFKDMELQKRAELINAYKPDFTIIIHYNVDETNTGWKKPGTKNFSMAFIGGAFMKKDLLTMEKRFEFLRMIITSDIESSVLLSDAIIKSLEANLLVKAAERKDATYLHQGCLYTGKNGVFCRNLQLTRNIHGPVVYGETLYQDNLGECILLNQEQDKLKNIRVQQAADAYYKGIKAYVESLEDKK